MILLRVPTINDSLDDFDSLFRLWRQVEREGRGGERVVLDFSSCYFLRQNAVAFLGGLIRYIQARGGTVNAKWGPASEAVRRNLARNGFLATFGLQDRSWVGNAIPYREDKEQDTAGIMTYLRSSWLGRGWINVSHALRDAIVGTMWEIYANAFEYGQSSVGVMSCGQYYPNMQMLKLTVVDFGVGIPRNVRHFTSNPRINPERALKWAFELGTTTNPSTSRGVGLNLLKDFVRRNRGRLEIFSHDAYGSIDSGGETYIRRPTYFEGTLVNITLTCDETFYDVSSGAVQGPFF